MNTTLLLIAVFSSVADASCFGKVCNNLTQYCDNGIEDCASCENGCHPGRIQTSYDRSRCERICPGWVGGDSSLRQTCTLCHQLKQRCRQLVRTTPRESSATYQPAGTELAEDSSHMQKETKTRNSLHL